MSDCDTKWATDKVAVVTGASVGIGAAVAVRLANLGAIVIGIARREDLINALNNDVTGSGKIHGRKCDVTNETEVTETFKWLEENFPPFDIFVNNAGINRANFIIESPTEDFQNLFDVNVIATCICLREAVRAMRKHATKGHVVVINSILGHQIPQVPVPLLSVYPATKHAVTALCETIRHEIHFHKLNIKLTSISPGMVDTDFLKVYKSYGPLPKLKADDVAQAVLYALNTPDYVQVEDIVVQAMSRNE